MSETIYLVRLRDVFNRIDYSDTEAEFNTEPNIRFFATREEAIDFAQKKVPTHNPFMTRAIDVMSPYTDTAILTVYSAPDEMHWEYYVRGDVTIGDLSQAPEEQEELVGSGRLIPENRLIDTIQEIGLDAPANSPRSQDDWRIWWDKNVATMTDAQRTAIWHLFTDNPYLILKIEAEL